MFKGHMVTLINTVEDEFARQVCSEYDNKPDALLEIFHTIQRERGYLSDASIRTIAYALNLSRAEVHGVVSFYHDFTREPGADITIRICRAEACQSVGCDDLIAQAEAEFGVKLDGANKTVKLESVFCLGNCALGPAILIDDNLYGRVDIDRLKSLVGEAL